MDIKKQNTNFSVEDLLSGKLAKDQFKVDFLPMWHYLDNFERKTNGFKDAQGQPLPMAKILEAVYEFGTISVGLEKADMTSRIDNLNEQNLRWFSKAQDLEKENERLKERLHELEKRLPK